MTELETDAIRLQPADNIATVLRAIVAGEQVRVRCGAAVTTVTAVDSIPLCHKMSLVAIEEGQAVVKYGQAIGRASAPVGTGEHVHVHNLRSARARVAARAAS